MPLFPLRLTVLPSERGNPPRIVLPRQNHRGDCLRQSTVESEHIPASRRQQIERPRCRSRWLCRLKAYARFLCPPRHLLHSSVSRRAPSHVRVTDRPPIGANPCGKVEKHQGGYCEPSNTGQAFYFCLPRVRRMLSPDSSMRWAL